MGLEISLFIGVLGLIIGSFLNVVIYRMPRGESVVFPGSHCTTCGHQLRSWELIPILSFLILGRRCALCKQKISWRYPAVELLTAALFFLAAWLNVTGLIARLGFELIFIAVLLVLAGIDFDTFRLPDIFTLPLLVLGLLAAVLLPGKPNGWESVLAALGVGGAFALIAWIYPQGMGLGDVKLVAALGACLGFPDVLLAIFVASVVGSLAGFLLLSLKKMKVRQQIPFGPFLVFGALIVLFWGEQMLDYYLNWL